MKELHSLRIAARSIPVLGSVRLGRARPFVLNHLVTVRCNVACSFCYVSGPEQQEFNRTRYPSNREMTTAEVRGFYRELVREGFRIAVIVGGEPLLRSDLDETLAVLEGHLFITVFTNGYLLPERQELLRRATNVFVSLDGIGAEHDHLRGRPGCFERALEGIERLRRAHPQVRLMLMTTVTAQNAAKIPDLLGLARELALPIGFQPPTYDGQFALDDRPSSTSAENLPTPDQAAEAFRRIKEASTRQPVVGSRAFFELVIRDQRRYPCHYPSHVLGPVLPNGDVVGCRASRVIGNVRDAGVRAVLKSPEFAANAEGSACCPRGCRDWGIHDLSAIGNGDFSLRDVASYYRSFVQGASASA